MKLATISQTQGVGGSVSQQKGEFWSNDDDSVCWQSAFIEEKAQLYTEVIKGVPTVMLLHFIEIQTLCSFCSKLCVVMLFWVLESTRSGFLLGFCSINGSRKNSNDILFHFFFC